MRLHIKENLGDERKKLKLANALIDMFMKEDYDFCVQEVRRTRKLPILFADTVEKEVKFIEDNSDYLLQNYNIDVTDYDINSLEEVADATLKQTKEIINDIWDEYGPKYV